MREIALGPDSFAELRSPGGASKGQTYALGESGSLAWMRVGDRDPVEIDGDVVRQERTYAAVLGLRFARPEPGDRLEIESCAPDSCTMAFVPRGGQTLWIDVDRKTNAPVSLQWIDAHRAVQSCGALTWTDDRSAIASAVCTAIVDHLGSTTITWKLEERLIASAVPAWAHVSRGDVRPLIEPLAPAEFAIADPSQRVLVPVSVGAAAPMDLVVDSGSSMTILTHRLANAMGVVAAPDAPVHVRPPWLPEDTYDSVLVDRMTIGTLELHGVPALVVHDDAPFSGSEAGLLGTDVFAHYVVDVDSPERTLRIWPRDVFQAPAGAVRLRGGDQRGSVTVGGAVDEIGPMALVLDTGAPINVIVGGSRMHVLHPRERGNDASLTWAEQDVSPDYLTEVGGLHFGPFGFPKMPAYSRDRQNDRLFGPLADGGALVGMGILRHFRIAFDLRAGFVHVVPGASYRVLRRLGVEIDDRDGVATITRVVGQDRAWRPTFREGDVVRAVNGRSVGLRADALSALASARGPTVEIAFERSGNPATRTITIGED